ncbi:hypothetical protein, partial [Shigella flexneri]|uniref:hypothetical protein n=1 Tax=Shigella flexneri TaxID=623 RepID=UPI0019D4235F
SGEYLPGSLQGKISSDGCSKKEQMVVSAIASTPQDRIIPLGDGIDRADLQARGFLTVMTHDRGSDC